MFIVLLKLAGGRDRAGQFMAAHKEWIRRGFDDGVFLLAGSLEPAIGGAIVAHESSLSELQTRINEDPFVRENVVVPEILSISPAKTDARLNFLSTD